MEQDTGFEPALDAWKASVLTANTNPADLPQKQLVGTVALESVNGRAEPSFALSSAFITITYCTRDWWATWGTIPEPSGYEPDALTN